MGYHMFVCIKDIFCRCLNILQKISCFLLQGPVVIVPTKYYKTPTQYFRDLGVSMVIWANHNLRSSITAMQGTTATIFKEQSLTSIEQNVRERERERVCLGIKKIMIGRIIHSFIVVLVLISGCHGERGFPSTERR